MTITFSTQVSADRIASLLNTLRHKPMTGPELAEAAGLGRTVTCEYLRHMHLTDAVHVAAWRQGRVAVYAAGAGRDAPHPVPKTSSQRRHAFMQRVYADEHQHDRQKAKRRLDNHIETAVKARKGVPAILRGLI